MIIIKFKVLILMVLAIIILSNCCNKESKIKYKYGHESRLISSLIKMNCKENNIAIYDEFVAHRLGKGSYSLENFSDNVGDSSFSFFIWFKGELAKDVLVLKRPRISICENGKLYIGRGHEWRSAFPPPECQFYFEYKKMTEQLKFEEDSVLQCVSLSHCFKQEEY